MTKKTTESTIDLERSRGFVTNIGQTDQITRYPAQI